MHLWSRSGFVTSDAQLLRRRCSERAESGEHLLSGVSYLVDACWEGHIATAGSGRCRSRAVSLRTRPNIQTVSGRGPRPRWNSRLPRLSAGLRESRSPSSAFDGPIHRGDLIVHEIWLRRWQRSRAPSIADRSTRSAGDTHAGADDEFVHGGNNTSAFTAEGLPGTGAVSHTHTGRAVASNPLIIRDRTDGGVPPSNADHNSTAPARSRRPAQGRFLSFASHRSRLELGGGGNSPDYQHF